MNGLFSKKFLKSIGVEIDDDTYVTLSEQYEQTLDNRVLKEIAEALDERQLKEFQTLKQASSEERERWLIENVPELDEIIEDEIAILLGEIAENNTNP